MNYFMRRVICFEPLLLSLTRQPEFHFLLEGASTFNPLGEHVIYYYTFSEAFERQLVDR